MPWLQEQSRELLEFALQHSSSCYLLCALEGTIYWVNDSFAQCMGYTPRELERRTWMDLSLKDENFEADVESAKQLESGAINSYSVMKFYLPKGEKPQLGWLNVQRYPQYGPLQVCICHWDPVREDSSPALAISTKAIDKMSASLDDLKEILVQIEQQGAATNLVQKGVVIWLKICAEYPKATICVALFFICLVGGSAAVNAIGAVKKIMTGDVTATP